MSSITPPADDTGLQSLRQSNKTDNGIHSISGLAATRAIHSSTGAPVTSGTHVNRRQRIDRRNKDRRQQKRRVLLDTRSYHERRTAKRGGSMGETNRPYTRGINLRA